MDLTHDDYHHSHVMLLPTGLAWQKETGALTELSMAITKAYHRVSQSSDALEKEVFPETSTYLLDEYEDAFGLPECESLGAQTTEQRRRAIYAKDTQLGDLSIAGLEALCASYGFDVDISVAHRHHCLRSCMYPIYPYDSQYNLIATVKTSSVHRMTCLDNILTPLIQSDDLAVTCLLDKYVIAGWEVIYIFKEEE